MRRAASKTPTESVEQAILLLRGQKVILDADLGKLYGVNAKRLNEQVRRNRARFPRDFAFRLTPEEKSEVVATCKDPSRTRFASTLPLAFTESGAIMAATVLNAPRAIEMSVLVTRAFIRLREVVMDPKELPRTLQKLGTHDEQTPALLEAICRLMIPPAREYSGFVSKEPAARKGKKAGKKG